MKKSSEDRSPKSGPIHEAPTLLSGNYRYFVDLGMLRDAADTARACAGSTHPGISIRYFPNQQTTGYAAFLIGT